MESWGFTLYLAQLAFVLSMGSQWGITLLSYNTRFILRASSDFVDLSDDLHFVEIIVRADFPNKQLIKKNRVLQGWLISCNNVLETTMIFIIYTLDVFWEQNSPVTFRHCASCPASPRAARLVSWHFLGGGRGRICPNWFWSERRAASRRWRPGRFYRSVHFPSISNQENNLKTAVVFFFCDCV